MATNIFDYAPDSPSPVPSPAFSPSPLPTSPSPTTMPSPGHVTSPSSSPAPNTPAAANLWGGHVKPAEVQIIVIVLIAGLFNAFFLTLSLRLLWRRYNRGQHMQPAAASTAPADIEGHIRRVTPMLVRQPDDELVYGLKQVLEDDLKPKEATASDASRT